MKNVIAVAAALIWMTATGVQAHEIGAHGGRQADAGDFHVEIVPQDKTLHVYLSDHSDRPVKTDGFKGTAILIVEGKAHRIPLQNAGENKLRGTAAVALPEKPKGAVQISGPGVSSIQAKFD